MAIEHRQPYKKKGRKAGRQEDRKEWNTHKWSFYQFRGVKTLKCNVMALLSYAFCPILNRWRTKMIDGTSSPYTLWSEFDLQCVLSQDKTGFSAEEGNVLLLKSPWQTSCTSSLYWRCIYNSMFRGLTAFLLPPGSEKWKLPGVGPTNRT